MKSIILLILFALAIWGITYLNDHLIIPVLVCQLLVVAVIVTAGLTINYQLERGKNHGA